MSRLAWVLLAVLVLTNAVWFLARDAGEGEDPLAGPGVPGREPGSTGATLAPPLHLGTTRPDVARTGSGIVGPRLDPARAAEMEERWKNTIRESRDTRERQQVVNEVRSALVSGEPRLTAAGLRTVPWLAADDDVRREFKSRIEAYLIDPNPDVRRAAVVGFAAVVPTQDDLDSLLPLVRDKDRGVRKEVPRAIAIAHDREIIGLAAEAFRLLLEDPDLSVRVETLRALHGAREIEQDVQGMVLMLVDSGDPLISLRALNALSGTELAKDAQVVEALVRALSHEEPKFRAEGRRGLLHGVPDVYGPQVSDAVADLLLSQTDLADRTGNIEVMGNLGTETHVEALTRLAEDESVPAVVRRAARNAIESIRAR